jgi:Rieske 2Fe-2S family protein
MQTFFPTYGFDPDQIPDRLRSAHQRYLAAEETLGLACTQRGLSMAAIEELDTLVSGFRIQREPLDGAGESYTVDGRAASRRLLGNLDTAMLGRVSMHSQPNGWLHLLADHAVTFATFPIAADRTLLRTTWLVHEDAQEGLDYDVANLTHVWRQTNEQDAVLCARAHQGVTSPAYLPGPYGPSEYQVDALVNWYVDRLRDGLVS